MPAASRSSCRRGEAEARISTYLHDKGRAAARPQDWSVLGPLASRSAPVRQQACHVRFGGDGFELLVPAHRPFRALAGFQFFKQLEFALGLQQVSALLGDLVRQLLASLHQGNGAPLNVRLEMRQRNVIVPGGGGRVADVCACLFKLRAERTDLFS